MKPAAAMPTYIGKDIVKVWRRAGMEFSVEWPLLCEKWKIILFGAIFQYVHGIGAKSAHYLHQPGPILHDVGFELLPELSRDKAFWSEYVFLSIFLPFVVWTFHPFVLQQKRFYTALIWPKVLVVLCICQFFRMASFTATQLPGPNYHCRLGSPAATLPPLAKLEDLLVLNLRKAGMFGCGDLIFSSHMTFTLTFVLTFNKYGTSRILKAISWLLLVVQSLLIIASRKHYSVDVVVAWYVVPLVYYFVDQHLADSVGQGEALDPRDRQFERSASTPLLPLKADNKYEHSAWMNTTHLNGAAARSQNLENEHRLRSSPANAKHADDTSLSVDDAE